MVKRKSSKPAGRLSKKRMQQYECTPDIDKLRSVCSIKGEFETPTFSGPGDPEPTEMVRTVSPVPGVKPTPSLETESVVEDTDEGKEMVAGSSGLPKVQVSHLNKSLPRGFDDGGQVIGEYEHLEEREENNDQFSVFNDTEEEEESIFEYEPGPERDADGAPSEKDSKPHVQLFPLTHKDMSAFLLTIGVSRLKIKQYERIYRRMKALSKKHDIGEEYPFSSTIARRHRRIAESTMFAKSSVKLFEVDMNKSGARGGVGTFLSDSCAPVMIVKPSEWARMDFNTECMRKIIWPDKKANGHVLFDNIEDCPVILNRALHLYPFSFPLEENKTVQIALTKDMTLSIHCYLSQSLVLCLEALGMKPIPGRGEFLNFTTSVRRWRHIDNAQMQDEEGKFIYGETSIARNGDVIVYLQVRNGRAILLFRVVANHKQGEFTTQLICQGEDGDNIQYFPVFNVFASGSGDKRPDHGQYVPPSGKLEDGRRYFVYRFLMYNDGFSPLDTKGSMDGCYIILLGIPARDRTPQGCVRRLWVTPPGVSSRDVMWSIIEDLRDGSVEGIKVTDEHGEATIFLDLVGYVGDYPAVTDIIDVMGHNSLVHCHLCFVRKNYYSGNCLSDYANDPGQNSTKMSLRRSAKRCAALRRCGVGKSVESLLKTVGLRRVTEHFGDPSPFHMLLKELEAVRPDVPKDYRGRDVVPCIFDPYLSCMISPDHLFLGLCHDLIGAVLHNFSPLQRQLAEVYIQQLLSSVHVCGPRKAFNVTDRKLRPMTISEMYAVLCVLPECIQTVMFTTRRESEETPMLDIILIEMVYLLYALVTETLRRPQRNVDGISYVKTYAENRGMGHVGQLQRMSEQYLCKVNKLCSMCKELKKKVDKPNLHRMVELYQHTVPMFVNVGFVLELILEKSHQQVKRAVRQSNFKNPQIQAMQHCIANDWTSRVGHQTRSIEKDGWDEKDIISIALLMGIDTTDGMDSKLRRKIIDTFTNANIEDLKSISYIMSYEGSVLFWDTCSQYGTPVETENVHPEESEEVEFLKVFCRRSTDYNLSVHRASSLRRISRQGQFGKLESKDKLEIGSSIEAVGLTVMSYMTNISTFDQTDGGEHMFFMCLRFYVVNDPSTDASNKRLFAVARPFKDVNICNGNSSVCDTDVQTSVEIYHRVSKDCGKIFVEMSHNIQSVMAIHACWMDNIFGSKKCVLDNEGITHCAGVHEGGIMVLKGRREGYPPRKG